MVTPATANYIPTNDTSSHSSLSSIPKIYPVLSQEKLVALRRQIFKYEKELQDPSSIQGSTKEIKFKLQEC